MTKRAARSIADVTRGTVLARVEIAAPPERVWKAITEEVASWWGSADDYTTTKHVVDLRRGGRFRSDGVGKHGPFHVEGEVLIADPPKTYATTWEPSWLPPGTPPTTVTYALEPIDIGTRVTVAHTGFTDAAACEDHATGWERVLTWLGGYTQPQPAQRYFMCKLLPPRPTFMADMTADERAIMMAHSQYWRGKLAEGKVVAFGPVGGPTGGFGLGIVAAADDAELASFQAGDPAIQSSRGFAYEAAPMAALVF